MASSDLSSTGHITDAVLHTWNCHQSNKEILGFFFSTIEFFICTGGIYSWVWHMVCKQCPYTIGCRVIKMPANRIISLILSNISGNCLRERITMPSFSSFLTQHSIWGLLHNYVKLLLYCKEALFFLLMLCHIYIKIKGMSPRCLKNNIS